MGFQKFSLFLALSTLVLYQVGNLHAGPFRSSLQSIPELTKLSEEQLHNLLAALAQDYKQMKAGNPAQGLETEGSSITTQKRACNTATYITHQLAGLLSRSRGVVKSNCMPTNVGSKVFGRRHRDLQA
ncbi:calcitonin gene-related peptide 2-like [Lemur catta]|uniref:calcitonin gene-related peptide 2-like n=1 Tax=Lemur catta TaxID=9447 RepID=UPI001E26D6D2|nr:calcitonin gene-related peptide 2-like [Lemur catta]